LSKPDRERRALHLSIQYDSETVTAAPGCLLSLEGTRAKWQAAGYNEYEEHGEIGQMLGMEGSRDGITTHIDARRVIVDGERRCLAAVVVTADK